MKAINQYCKCWRKDPICNTCGLPQRLHNNWFYKFDGTWERRKHVTKKQDAALRKLVEFFTTTLIREIINPEKWKGNKWFAK